MTPRRHRDLDDALAGRPPSGAEDARLAAFVEDVRRAHTERPDEATAGRHLAAIVKVAADTADAPAAPTAALRRPARPRALRLAAAAGLAVAGFAGGTTGLAAAGVVLPDPVMAPFDAVGVSLPNQDGQGADRPRPARTAPQPGEPATPASRTAAEPAGDDERGRPRGRGGERRRQDPPRDERGRADGTRRRENPPALGRARPPSQAGGSRPGGAPARQRTRDAASRGDAIRRRRGAVPRRPSSRPGRRGRVERERAPAKPPAPRRREVPAPVPEASPDDPLTSGQDVFPPADDDSTTTSGE